MTTTEINRVAIHEAGHAVVANHFGIASVPEIFLDERTFPGTALIQAGQCELEPNHSPYEGCCIAWAGLLAECVLGEKIPPFAPPFRPTSRDLESWHSMMFCRMKDFSPGDRALIIRGYKQSLKACRNAYRIIRKNTAALKRLAKHLASDATKRQAVTNEPIGQMNPTIPRLPEPEPEPLTDILRETPLEIPGRAQVLKGFLARMKSDDPQRPKFQRMLECLERGEMLPNDQ